MAGTARHLDIPLWAAASGRDRKGARAGHLCRRDGHKPDRGWRDPGERRGFSDRPGR